MEALLGFISKENSKDHFMFLFKVLFTILFSLAIYLLIFDKLTIKLNIKTVFTSIKKGSFFIGIIIYILTWHFFYYFLLGIVTIIITNIQHKIYLFIKKEKIKEFNILESFISHKDGSLFKLAEKFRFFKLQNNQIILDVNHVILEKSLKETKEDPSNTDISYPLESIILIFQFLLLYVYWIQPLNDIPNYFSVIVILTSIFYTLLLFLICIAGLFIKLHTSSILKYFDSIKNTPIQ